MHTEFWWNYCMHSKLATQLWRDERGGLLYYRSKTPSFLTSFMKYMFRSFLDCWCVHRRTTSSSTMEWSCCHQSTQTDTWVRWISFSFISLCSMNEWMNEWMNKWITSFPVDNIHILQGCVGWVCERMRVDSLYFSTFFYV